MSDGLATCLAIQRRFLRDINKLDASKMTDEVFLATSAARKAALDSLASETLEAAIVFHKALERLVEVTDDSRGNRRAKG